MALVLKGSQFYLHALHSSANGMNHACLCLQKKTQKWCKLILLLLKLIPE